MTALTSEQIKEIADTIDCGFACHWNIKNNSLIFIPNDEGFDPADKFDFKNQKMIEYIKDRIDYIIKYESN